MAVLALNSKMKSIRSNESSCFPFSLFYFVPILIINHSEAILFTISPISNIFVASDKLEPSIAVFPSLFIISMVELAIFPHESAGAMINTVAPLALIAIFNIEGGKLNFALPLWGQATPVNFTLIHASVPIVNFGLSFVKIQEINFFNVFVFRESQGSILGLRVVPGAFKAVHPVVVYKCAVATQFPALNFSVIFAIFVDEYNFGVSIGFSKPKVRVH